MNKSYQTTFYSNHYRDFEQIYHFLGQGTNTRDPRINGFLVFAYSDEDLTASADTPWQPIIEVDLDRKEYKNWTYDDEWRKLILNNEQGSEINSTSVGYTTSPDFSHGGTKNSEKPPSPYGVTYSSLIPYLSNEPTKVRWKASAVVNGRAVIGNIYKNGSRFGDRIMVSAPGTYDVFPEELSYDAGVTDGQSIVAMKSFGDKVLVFKEDSMYILNFTDPNNFFVEGEYTHYGINHPASVCQSDYGVSWVSRLYGVMHYDGKEIIDLGEDKLKITDLAYGFQDGNIIESDHIPSIGFESTTKTLIVIPDIGKNYDSTGYDENYTEAAWSYDFDTEDWSLMSKFQYHISSQKIVTNMVNDYEGNLTYWKSANDGGNFPHFTAGLILPYRVDCNVDIAFDAQHVGKYKTKEIDFGDMGMDKHVYKVVAKYKKASSTGAASTGFELKAYINGSTTPTVFADPYLNSNTSEWVVEEFNPNSAAQFKNLKTISLELTSVTAADSNFELDSLTIVYRTKGVAT